MVGQVVKSRLYFFVKKDRPTLSFQCTSCYVASVVTLDLRHTRLTHPARSRIDHICDVLHLSK